MNRCGRCRYFFAHAETCRRNPPIGQGWSRVNEHDWCGEYKTAAVAFVKPSLTEVSNYCAGRKNTVDPLAFFNFYQSKGWMVGKSKMKDWKAAVRNWEKIDEKRKGSGKQSATERNADLHGYLDSKISG